MKTCPNCNQDNPSKARFCTNCGHSLDEERLPEELLLRNELSEAKDTIKVLKESLGQAQQHKKLAEEYKQTIKTLQHEISEKDNNIITLSNTINGLDQSLTQTKNKRGKWGWIFVCLFVLVCLVLGSQLNKNNNLESHNNVLSENLAVLNKKIQASQEKNTSISTELESKTLQLQEVTNKYKKLQRIHPVIIKNIDIAFVDGYNEIITDYGYTLYSRNAKFIQPKITYTSTENQSVAFKCKLYFNNKWNNTWNSNRTVSEGENVLTLTKCGRDTYYNWGTGSYTLEIWVGDVCLKSKNFNIY